MLTCCALGLQLRVPVDRQRHDRVLRDARPGQHPLLARPRQCPRWLLVRRWEGRQDRQ